MTVADRNPALWSPPAQRGAALKERCDRCANSCRSRRSRRSSPLGAPNNPESLWNTFQNVLRFGLSDLRVAIQDQVVEGDEVTTRKTITGVHSGELMGVAPTGRPVAIDVVRVEDGRHVEHWGVNALPSVLHQLRAD